MLGLPVEELNVPVRVYNGLKRLDCATAGDVAALSGAGGHGSSWQGVLAVGTVRASASSDTLMSMSRFFLLLIVLVVGVAACAAPSEDRVVQESSDGRFERVEVDDVPIWRRAGGSSDGLDALVVGAIGYDEDCGIHLHNEQFDLRYPVVWPAGTDIQQADPLTIRLPDGAIVEAGQIVSGGGGYHPDLSLFPEGCAESGETAVFNASADVEIIASATEPAEPTAPTSVSFERCADLEAPPPAPDGPLSEDAEVAAAQQARAALSLSSDVETVEALLAAGNTGTWLNAGTPTTQEEFDAVMARNAIDQIGGLQEWASATHADTWGGLWLDQARGGLVTVAFTADVDARVADIAERYGLEVRGVEVAFTEAELSAAQDILDPVMMQQWEGREEAGPQPGDLTWSAVHTSTNRLQVGMYTDDEAAKQRLAELVDPAMICLDIEEVPTDEDAAPASWAPSADADLSADSTAIALDVIEQACASGSTAEGRIVVHDIRYDEDAVTVTIGVIPLAGGNECPGNPITPFTLELDEPLGSRQLLDGADGVASEPILDR